MKDIKDYLKNPVFAALNELDKEINVPLTLDIVGGFALMVQDIRDPSGITDVDYVGKDLVRDIKDIADDIGLKHHLGKGWLNNDLLLSGTTLEDLEFSTGKLHFSPAFELDNIRINVLNKNDLLRMKVIAVDTALTAVQMGGDFTRKKDLKDIKLMMDKMDLTMSDLDRYSEYIICEDTLNVIDAYVNKGEKAAMETVLKSQIKAAKEMLESCKNTDEEYERSDYMENMLNDLFGM